MFRPFYPAKGNELQTDQTLTTSMWAEQGCEAKGRGGGHAFDLCGGITTKLSTNDYIHTYLWVTLSGLSMTLSHAHTLNKQTHQTKAIHSGKNTQRQQLVWVGWDLRDHLRPSPLQAPNSHYC